MTAEVVLGLEGVPIAESGISFVDGKAGRLEYRGISIEDLAEHSTFEETAYLLLFGKLPTREEADPFQVELRTHRRLKYRILDLIKCLPETGHPMDALQAGIDFLVGQRAIRDAERQAAADTVFLAEHVAQQLAGHGAGILAVLQRRYDLVQQGRFVLQPHFMYFIFGCCCALRHDVRRMTPDPT